MVLPPSPSTPPEPGAPVTLPAANALAMTPVLKPTSPPAVPFEPTKTSPIASEKAMVPKFSPTSPPADTCWHELPNPQS